MDDVKLTCGNDYVEYKLDISKFDEDSTYKLEVSNSIFKYSTDLDIDFDSETLYLDGFVYGLKPNYKYEFKLLRDNGEVVGYSAYYTQSFYTTKAPDPIANFEFEVNDNLVTFTSYLSDYYDLLSDSYLIVEVDDKEERFEFNDKECTSTILSTNKNPITFFVYSTLYDSPKLIGSYCYNLTNINSTYKNNEINVYGNIGDIYKNIKGGELYLYTYDENAKELSNEKVDIDLSTDIDFTYTLDSDASTYLYKIVGNNKELYTSNLISLKTRLNLVFGKQELTNDSLKLQVTGYEDITNGYILDSNNNKVDVEITNDILSIPLFDKDNNRITYDNYNLVLDDFHMI